MFLLVSGLACRIFDLGRLPLWSDEAESSINALTILEQGIPADRYLGQPLYENWMVQPWPENAEFEFRDISYSDKRVAVYHGWLPLYAIASSFRLLGILPSPAGLKFPLYDAAERRRRTIAARVPSVLFGVLCIVGFYLAGCRLHDSGVGIIAALLATFLAADISYSQTARYYAATTAGLTFSLWSVLAMRQSARLRDYLLGGVLFSLLFYTNVLSFAVASLMWAIAMASMPRRWRTVWPKALAFSVMLLVLCVPWLIGTGFLRQNARIPRAWTMINLPQDLFIGRFLFSEFGAVLTLVHRPDSSLY